MRLVRQLRRLLARPRHEIALVFEALLWLALVRAALVVLPFRRIVGLAGLTQRSSAGPAPLAAIAGEPARIGWALGAAAAHTPWQSTCLCQALAGAAMLRRRRLPSTLYLGVARDASAPERVAAHAWLCCDDAIVTGAGVHAQFRSVATFVSGAH